MHRERPSVTLSYAQSLDGSLAVRRGAPLALSGPQALRLTHELRAAHQAILVGVGTVLADDPRLNVRLVEGLDPIPVILDTHLRTPLSARILQGSRQPWILTVENELSQSWQALQGMGARLLQTGLDQDGHLHLPAVLALLRDEGIERLMVEGGASVIRSLLAQNLADQAVITIAPVFVGGLNALAGLEAIQPFPRLVGPTYQQLGEDLIVRGRLVRANQEIEG